MPRSSEAPGNTAAQTCTGAGIGSGHSGAVILPAAESPTIGLPSAFNALAFPQTLQDYALAKVSVAALFKLPILGRLELGAEYPGRLRFCPLRRPQAT